MHVTFNVILSYNYAALTWDLAIVELVQFRNAKIYTHPMVNLGKQAEGQG